MSVGALDDARRLLDAGQPRAALALAESALEASRGAGSPATQRRAAHLVAEARFVVGDIAGARVLAGEALRLSQAADDLDALGEDLNLLGTIDIVEERPDEAVFLLRRSYDLRAEAGGPDSPGAIESLRNLAFAIGRAGGGDEALELLEDALRRCERSLGADHPRTAETLAALAVTLGPLPGEEKRARALHERALASGEAAHGPDSALVARLLANVAVARIDDGDLEGAGPPLERALELHERHFGPDSRWTGYVVQTQGEWAYEQGRYDDARSAFERALVLRVRELGTERSETLESAAALLRSLEKLEATEDATALQRALDSPVELRRIAAGIESRRRAAEVRA